jgi:Rieske Fe-S protein
MTQRSLSRRTVLGGAAAVGGAAVLAACGSGDDTSDDTSDATTDDAGDDAGDDTTDDTTEGEDDSAEGSDDGEAAGDALVAAADVPVGSGVIIGAARVVVTQPSEGEFKGFSSTCTHQGCQVSSVSGDTITCACHNSTFSVADGSVLGGPATAPLPEVPVALDGDQVVPA